MAYVQKPRWTSQQENFIRDNWEHMTDEQISIIVGRSLKSVRRKRERMGLKKASGRGVCAPASDTSSNESESSNA